MSGARPRLGAGPRSLRAKVLLVGLVMALLPLLLLAIAWTYEQALIAQEQRRLRAAAAEALKVEARAQALDALAARERLVIARLGPEGAVLARSDTMALALERSAVGRIGERLVGSGAPESLAVADAAFEAWSARPEVQGALAGRAGGQVRLSPSGQTLVVALAEPAPGGGALYLLVGSHRGVRRLVLLSREFLQLAMYEVVLSLPLLLLFGLRFVRPIERLADAASRYPAVPLADPTLLARNDEIATLAGILATMAEDLDRRRRQAAELGADIAHEFKNPLASITASAELLTSSKVLTPDRVALVSSTIEQSVERLRRSIDELLSLLRLEQAVPGEAREPVAYAALLEAVLESTGAIRATASGTSR